MKKSSFLLALLGLAAPGTGQTAWHIFRLFDKATPWFEGYRYTDTTHGAEVIQGFPASFFAGLRRIDGVYFTFFDTDRTFGKTYSVLIRRDAGGKPDIASPPLAALQVKTRKLQGRGPAYPMFHLFPKPFFVPPGTKTIWIGVRFGPDPSPKSQVWFGALARHGKGGRPGVLSRKGAPNPKLAWRVVYDAQGRPGPLTVSDDHWVWTTGILTKAPVLRPYIKLNVDVPPHQGGSIAGKVLHGMAAMWPDIDDAEGLPAPGRSDLLGWTVDQNFKKAKNDTLWGFVFLQDRLLARPAPLPWGTWFLGFGGPYQTVGALFSPLTNGTWSTPALAVPPAVRPFLKGRRLYAQAAVLELDPALKVVDLQLTNMAAMDL